MTWCFLGELCQSETVYTFKFNFKYKLKKKHNHELSGNQTIIDSLVILEKFIPIRDCPTCSPTLC